MSHFCTTTDLNQSGLGARRAPLLDREQELELANRWRQHGDRSAAEALARAHLRFVMTVAKTYQRYGVLQSELIAEGSFGIVQALQKVRARARCAFRHLRGALGARMHSRLHHQVLELGWRGLRTTALEDVFQTEARADASHEPSR